MFERQLCTLLLSLILILNVSSLFAQDSLNVTLIGSVELPAVAQDIAVGDTVVYLAGRNDGLGIINIANPANPGLIGFVDTPGTTYGVATNGDLLAVADRHSGVMIYTLEDPESPTPVAQYNSPGLAYSSVFDGNYILTADFGNGIFSLNANNPQNPTIAGTIDTPGLAYDVAFSGHYAYVADFAEGMRIVDMEPFPWDEVGAFTQVEEVIKVEAQGRIAYILDEFAGLILLDVSEPTDPIEISRVEYANSVSGLDVHLDYAYVIDTNGRLSVIDIVDPLNPIEVGFYDRDMNDANRGIEYRDNRVYVANGDLFDIYDVSGAIRQQPDPFSLLSPLNGDTVYIDETVLEWQETIDGDIEEAPNYDVWLDTLPDLSTAWQIGDSLIANSTLAQNLIDDHFYYWTVRATDNNTTGRWATDTLEFHVYIPEPPLNFSKISPENGVTVNDQAIQVTWESATDPDPSDILTYAVHCSVDENFTEYFEGFTQDTTFLLSEIDSEGTPIPDQSTIYWRVKAIDPFENETWANGEDGAWNFFVEIHYPPAPFGLLTP
ncbi:hypothetical protein K8I28_08780, partial [bacterium]|nr:hypothetical protein [bacterium]